MSILTFENNRFRNYETGESYGHKDITILCPAIRVLARTPDGKDNITPNLSLFTGVDGIVVYPFNPREEQLVEPGDEQMVRIAPYNLRRR